LSFLCALYRLSAFAIIPVIKEDKTTKPNYVKGSRPMRRLINNFPYYRLVQYIKYKAAWRSIRTLEISEADNSNTCFKCHTKDKKARKTQGLFQCGNCSIRTNADYNGAMNILQRGVGILSTLGLAILDLVSKERSNLKLFHFSILGHCSKYLLSFFRTINFQSNILLK
jgi:transposase